MSVQWDDNDPDAPDDIYCGLVAVTVAVIGASITLVATAVILIIWLV